MDNKIAEYQVENVTETTFKWIIPDYSLRRANFSETFRLKDGLVM